MIAIQRMQTSLLDMPLGYFQMLIDIHAFSSCVQWKYGQKQALTFRRQARRSLRADTSKVANDVQNTLP